MRRSDLSQDSSRTCARRGGDDVGVPGCARSVPPPDGAISRTLDSALGRPPMAPGMAATDGSGEASASAASVSLTSCAPEPFSNSGDGSGAFCAGLTFPLRLAGSDACCSAPKGCRAPPCTDPWALLSDALREARPPTLPLRPRRRKPVADLFDSRRGVPPMDIWYGKISWLGCAWNMWLGRRDPAADRSAPLCGASAPMLGTDIIWRRRGRSPSSGTSGGVPELVPAPEPVPASS